MGKKEVSSWSQFLMEELALDGRWYMKGISQLQKGRQDDPVMDTNVPIHSGLLGPESGLHMGQEKSALWIGLPTIRPRSSNYPHLMTKLTLKRKSRILVQEGKININV